MTATTRSSSAPDSPAERRGPARPRRRARARARSAQPARRTGDGVSRSRDRRARRQRPARAARLLRETLSFLDDIGARDHVRIQPQLAVTMIDRARRPQSRLDCPALPPPLHLLAGVFDWEALTWRIGCRCCGWPDAAPTRAARSSSAARDAHRRLAGRDRRELADPQRPDAAPARDAVGSAGAGGAEPAAVARRRAGLRARAGRDVRPRPAGRGDRAADPAAGRDVRRAGARSTSSAAAATVRTGAPARVALERRSRRGASRAARTSWTRRAVISRGALVRAADLFEGDIAPLDAAPRAAPARCASSPIVTVNLWFDRPILDEPFIGLPGRAMQWVFDKRLVFGDVGVAPVAGVERRRRRSSARRTPS